MQARWDIFCTVVDNYGDIGVTWRLARQLVAEHGLVVRLWVDDLHAFQRLCPAVDPYVASQWHAGVEVRFWSRDWQPVEPGDVVVEAFACQVPAAFEAAMVRRSSKSLWLNLEYLSAEAWVEGCHGLPSPQANGLQKFFFFPGFAAGTGGLLRERDLLAQRQAFQADVEARRIFLQALGVQPLPGARLVSLFAYENPALAAWLDALVTAEQVTQLLVPAGRIQADLQHWLGTETTAPGDSWQRGHLHIHVLPFMPQADYDRLLWACEFNAVRGEDSFVRAQWAGRPLLWHIYKQDEDTHLEKLEAFTARYRQGLPVALEQALTGLGLAWNQGDGEVFVRHWQAVQAAWPELRAHAERWSAEQASRPDLATALVQFYRNWLSCAA
ncbi:elongation factor P maturation arginine rhamnosyltransferase EarP [Aquipseudomonas campi]